MTNPGAVAKGSAPQIERCPPHKLRPEVARLIVVLARNGHFSASEIWGGLDLFAFGVSLRSLRHFAKRLRVTRGASSEHSVKLAPESLAGIIADYLLAVGDATFATNVLDRLCQRFGIAGGEETTGIALEESTGV